MVNFRLILSKLWTADFFFQLKLGFPAFTRVPVTLTFKGGIPNIHVMKARLTYSIHGTFEFNPAETLEARIFFN